MKTIITTNPNATTGYELRIIHDDGAVETKPIDKIVDDGKTLKLPENPSNRKYWAINRLTGSETELTYKESKTFGPRDPNATPKAPTKGWVEYLTDEEKAIYEQLKTKAEVRIQKAKLKAQIEADQARLAELEAQA